MAKRRSPELPLCGDPKRRNPPLHLRNVKFLGATGAATASVWTLESFTRLSQGIIVGVIVGGRTGFKAAQLDTARSQRRASPLRNLTSAVLVPPLHAGLARYSYTKITGRAAELLTSTDRQAGRLVDDLKTRLFDVGRPATLLARIAHTTLGKLQRCKFSTMGFWW